MPFQPSGAGGIGGGLSLKQNQMHAYKNKTSTMKELTALQSKLSSQRSSMASA